MGRAGKTYPDEPSIRITCQKIQYCNLGWLLTKGDVNGDGRDDLIISSPYANTGSDQSGLVSVLLSKKSNYSSVIDVGRLDWILSGQMPYEWFGFSVKAKLDLLVVGAPQSRLCSRPDCQINSNDKQAIGRVYFYQFPATTPFLTLAGQDEFEEFGYDFDLTKRKDYNIVFAVSSVGKKTRINNRDLAFDLHLAGQVQAYSIQTTGKPTFSLLSILKSDRSYAAFGSKVQVKLFKNHD